MSDTHSKNGDGEQYLLRLIAEQEQGDAINDNCALDIEDGFDDEDSCFTTITVEDCEADNDSTHSIDRALCEQFQLRVGQFRNSPCRFLDRVKQKITSFP